MPTKKNPKTLKSTARKLATKSGAAARKTVAKGKAVVAKGKATAARTVTKGKAVAKKAVAKGKATARSAAKKVPTKRQSAHAATGFVGHLKEGVQSGIDAVGRMVKKVTPDALLPKTARSRRKTR